MSAASNLPASVIAGFVDSPVNALVDLDTRREVVFSLVPIGHTASTPPASPEIPPLSLPIVPYSTTEVDYPAMRKMHEASSLDSANEAATWRCVIGMPAAASPAIAEVMPGTTVQAMPAAASAPAAVKLFNSAAATGLGRFTVTPTINVSIPGNSYAGTYSSTITVAAVSGP